MRNNNGEKIEDKKIKLSPVYWKLVGLVYFLFLVLYYLMVNVSEGFSYKLIGDTIFNIFVFVTPIIVGVTLIFIKQEMKILKILLNFIWSFLGTATLGIGIFLTYCEEMKCFNSIAVFIVLLIYHFILFIVFICIFALFKSYKIYIQLQTDKHKKLLKYIFFYVIFIL